MIRKFTCENFRNIACNDLEFERINILIGPNNAGKSNFIRALSFAANMVNNSKSEKTGFLTELKRNGWHSVSNRRIEDTCFHLRWHFELEEGYPVAYSLRTIVSKKRDGNYIAEEKLESTKLRKGATEPYNYFLCHSPNVGKGEFSTAGMSSNRNYRIPAEVDQNESVLLQMDSLFFKNKELFSSTFVRDRIRDVLDSMRRYFRGFYSYSCTAFDIAEIREMQDEQNDGTSLQKNGANFVNVFYNMESNEPDFKNRYLRILKRLMAECEDVCVRDAGGKIWMEVKMNGIYFPLSEVSDGTIHLLVLLLMLTMSEHSGISMLAIDEPEMNLHPAWQKVLANELQHCQSFKQCFISTHSPDFLDEFTEGFLNGEVGVLVFDASSRFPIRKLDRRELCDDLKNWTLGDLYRVGDPVIGGWPQ